MENARKTDIFFDIKKCYTCNVTFFLRLNATNAAAAGVTPPYSNGVFYEKSSKNLYLISCNVTWSIYNTPFP
jgi:hypothetical protein